MLQEYALISRAWGLVASWSLERPPTTPLARDIWVYRAAWRDWIRWRKGAFVRVKTRCKQVIDLDIRPLSMVAASIKLGLSKPIFRGDRFHFLKSSGRPLQVPSHHSLLLLIPFKLTGCAFQAREEAVVLGCFKGYVWYRLDNKQGAAGESLADSSSLAWCLIPADVEGIAWQKRIGGGDSLPDGISDLPLPRIPAFHGGLLLITFENGAVMR